MRGKSWDLRRKYSSSVLSGAADEDMLREKILRKTGWDAVRNMWDVRYALGLPDGGTFTCAAIARTCWGYATDGPSAAEGPVLITGIPADVQAIVGGRWTGTAFVTTDTSGNTLNPYTLKSTPSGTVKVFTSYATYAVGTAYAAGRQLAILTTAGNRVYMQSSGGTSAGAAVTIADSDIGGAVVADNDINWSVLGYATGLAEQLEAASENELFPYDTPATQTTGSLGTGTWTLQVFGSGSALISAGTATINGEAACTEGSPNTINVTGAGTVTVTKTGALDYWQLEAGTFPSSLIPTVGTTLARAGTLFQDTTAGRSTDASGAGKIVVCTPIPQASLNNKYFWGMHNGATNQIGIYVNGTSAVLIGNNGSGADFLTQLFAPVANEPFAIEWYWEGTTWALRAYNIGEAVPAFTTAVKQTMAINTSFRIGDRGDGGGPSTLDTISCELSINKEDLNFE